MFPDYAWTNEINKPFFLMQHNLSEEKILKEALSERFHQISEKIMNKVSNPLVYQIPRIQIQKNQDNQNDEKEIKIDENHENIIEEIQTDEKKGFKYLKIKNNLLR